MTKKINFALLNSNCKESEVKEACELAISLGFHAVCIPPYFVKSAAELLSDSVVKVATVIGYPLGYSATPAKVEEIKRALDEEVDELSVVLNTCAIRNANWKYVKNDISSVTNAVHLKGKKIAIIIDPDILTKEELENTLAICIKNEVNAIQLSFSAQNRETLITRLLEIKKMLPAKVNLNLSVNTNEVDTAIEMVKLGVDGVVMNPKPT